MLSFQSNKVYSMHEPKNSHVVSNYKDKSYMSCLPGKSLSLALSFTVQLS